MSIGVAFGLAFGVSQRFDGIPDNWIGERQKASTDIDELMMSKCIPSS